MAFTLENLTIATNHIKAGVVPSLWIYYNENNDSVIAANYFQERRLTVGDIISVVRDDNTGSSLYRISAKSTDGTTATATALAGAYQYPAAPETVTAATNLYDTLSQDYELSLLVTTAASIDVVFTANATTDLITPASGTLIDNMIVQASTTGTLPAGLSISTNYYTVSTNTAGTACKLSASLGGAAINITDAGTGVHTLEVTENAFRLADGVEGQRKLVKFKTDGTLDARIICDNLLDGTTIVFGTANESVNLAFANSTWNIVANDGGTVA